MADSGSTATAGGASNGGDIADGGSLTGASLAGGSLAGGSVASESVAENSGGKPPAADSIAGGEEVSPPSVLRVIELKAAEDSEIEAGVEAAQMLLPEPAVPAPDPKMVAIPPEKVRQQVRRPAPRVKRQPLQTLEILPVQPQGASPTSSRPGSRNATGKARAETKPKVEQQVAVPAQDKQKGDGGDDGRAASGALEGNPYRWVVSFLCFLHVKRWERSWNKDRGWPCLLTTVYCSNFRLTNISQEQRHATPRNHEALWQLRVLGDLPKTADWRQTYVAPRSFPSHAPMKRSVPEIRSVSWSSFRAPTRVSSTSP